MSDAPEKPARKKGLISQLHIRLVEETAYGGNKPWANATLDVELPFVPQVGMTIGTPVEDATIVHVHFRLYCRERDDYFVVSLSDSRVEFEASDLTPLYLRAGWLRRDGWEVTPLQKDFVL